MSYTEFGTLQWKKGSLMKKDFCIILICLIACSLFECSNAGDDELLPATTPKASITPTLNNTQKALETPTMTMQIDPEIVRYLDGAESLLSHSSTILYDQAQSFADVCPERYIAAFPFRTSRTDRISLVIAFVSLRRHSDGKIVEGEHKLLWTWRQEGIEPYEIDRVEWLMQDEKWPLTLRFLVIFAGKWMVGITSGTCPGDDIQLVGLFELDHPEEFSLEITRFSDGAPFDFWLQDGDRLTHYHWESWKAIPISTLQPTPGQLVGVTWGDDSPDLNVDSIPEITIRWKVNGEFIELMYSEDTQGLHPID